MTELPPQMPDQRPPPTAKDAGCGCLVILVIIGIAASVILFFGVLPERKAAREMEARMQANRVAVAADEVEREQWRARIQAEDEKRRAAMSPEERERADADTARFLAESRRDERAASRQRDGGAAEIAAAVVIVCAEVGDCPSGMRPGEARRIICERTGDC